MARERISDEDAQKAAEELEALRRLLACDGWTKFLTGWLASKQAEHLGGMSALSSTPEKRSEHVQAWHLAKDAPDYPAKRVESLTNLLKRYRDQEM
jgi:hypothetical protein